MAVTAVTVVNPGSVMFTLTGKSVTCGVTGVVFKAALNDPPTDVKAWELPGTTRASFYFYNTLAEVDRFIEVVKEIQDYFTK